MGTLGGRTAARNQTECNIVSGNDSIADELRKVTEICEFAATCLSCLDDLDSTVRKAASESKSKDERIQGWIR